MSTLFTVGHSTRTADAFLELLGAYQIGRLVDIRMFPASRRYPHFNAQALATALAAAGIDYRHEAALGGRRHGEANSTNAYWRNASFRAYADYMASDEFDAAIGRVIALAAERPTAIMCAEAVPWRCHRWLVSDALVARGIDVVHLLDTKHVESHVLNPAARIDPQGKLSYPVAADQTPSTRPAKRVPSTANDRQGRMAFDPPGSQHSED